MRTFEHGTDAVLEGDVLPTAGEPEGGKACRVCGSWWDRPSRRARDHRQTRTRGKGIGVIRREQPRPDEHTPNDVVNTGQAFRQPGQLKKGAHLASSSYRAA